MSRTVVLLPFATPCPGFKTWSVFHPAALSMPRRSRKGDFELDENSDYAGFQSVKIAAQISHTIVATIPPKATIPGMMLEQLLSTYVDPENILAEIERVEHSSESIASQVACVFDLLPGYDSVTVIWPYQHFNQKEAILGKGEAAFAYHHPMLTHNISKIPEAIGVRIDQTSETDCNCLDLEMYSNIDTLLKGSYTTTLSMVEIKRDDFEQFKASSDYPDLSKLFKKTLVGKRGVLVNPTESGFIGA